MKNINPNEVFFLIKPFGFYKKLVIKYINFTCTYCCFATTLICKNSNIYCYRPDYFVKSNLIEYLKYKFKLWITKNLN